MKTMLILFLLTISATAQQQFKSEFQSRYRDCPEPKGLKMNEAPGVTVTKMIEKSLATDSYWYTPTSWVGDLDKKAKRTPTRKARRGKRSRQ